MTFAERLKQLREKAKLTQELLAQKAETSIGNVRNYEQGIRIPTAPVLFALAKALGVGCEAFADSDFTTKYDVEDKGKKNAAKKGKK